jgi:hypothetical protein
MSTLDGFPDFFQFAVNQLVASCPGSSVGSGARTAAQQQALVDDLGLWSPTNPGAAQVGTSNHQVGVGHGAADMSGDLECLRANAARFGLHFPIANEAWHIEPMPELIEAGMAFFGQTSTEEGQPEAPEDDLSGIRDMIFGSTTVGGDIPGRVREGFAPEAAPVAVQGPLSAGEPEAGAFTPQASAGFEAGSGSSLSAVDVAKVYAQAGFTGDALVTMVAIARGESGWNPGAAGDTSITNGTWGPSLGLSQIRSVNAQRGTGGWRDADALLDPAFNARAAFAISNGGTDFGPWTVYSAGIYQQFVEEAKAAVTALGTGAMAAGATAPPAASVDPGAAGDDYDIMNPAEMMKSIADELLGGFSDPGDIVQERVTDPGARREEEDDETDTTNAGMGLTIG